MTVIMAGMSSGEDPTSGEAHAETTPLAPGARVTPSPGPAAFAAGALVAGRYRVTRLLGEGGMGEVYEAEDQLLRERVALKTIRREVARDDTTAARFKREIQLARKVTHANVCRIFDVGLHGDAPFITMELLSGETLSARLKRGRPPLDEAEDIARQLVAALAAAHEVGVIHRDFKSPNVMLVRRAGAKGLRAVVTDFGLARALEEDAALAITGDGGIVGSPAYMAPEQVEGKLKVTEAADIYALGVVLFELATGRLPFVGETPLATMTMRLREPPPPPRSIVAELPERWEQTVLRCLERDPARRFARVDEVAAALAAPVAPRRRVWLVATVAAAVAAAVVIAIPRGHAPEPPPAPAAHSGRPSVAILGFKNLSGRSDADYLASLLAEFLATDLTAGELVRTADGESIARARRELALPETDSFAKDTLAKLGARLGSEYVVVGAYALMGGDDIHVDLRLQDTRSGATVASISDDGKKDDVLKLVERLAAKVRGKLDVGDLSASQRAGLAAALPEKPEVQKLYAEGLAQLRVEACSAARGPLEQAIAAEPGFAPAHSALSEALQCLGFDTRADEEARRAVELSSKLTEDAQLAARAHLEELTGAHDKALVDYAALFRKFPDDASYAQHLVRHQLRAGQLQEARATLAALRKLPGGDNAETDLNEEYVETLGGSGTVADRRLRLEKIRARAEREGSRLIIGTVLLEEAQIDLALGQLERARAEAAEAKGIFQAAADHDGELQAMTAEVGILSRLGDTDGVRREHETAQAVARSLDGARSFYGFDAALSAALAAQGDLDGARRVYDEMREWSRSRGRKSDEASALWSLADVQLDQADLAGAGSSLDEAAALLGDKAATSGMLMLYRGRLALMQGDAAGAHARFTQFAATLPIAGAQREALDQMLGAAVLEAENRLAEAEAAYTRARELVVQKAGRAAAVQTLPFLAAVLLDEGKVKEARALLDGVTPDERKAADADVATSLSVRAAFARLLATSGKAKDVAAARQQLVELSARARKAGFVTRAFGIELGLGRVELQAGQTAAGRATLTALAKDARAHGATLYAKKAEAALAR
jgi:tRNA A-37 threonylcarbamoyl transferase component Bud32/TolB-like protein